MPRSGPCAHTSRDTGGQGSTRHEPTTNRGTFLATTLANIAQLNGLLFNARLSRVRIFSIAND
jgi:hypothetical protein